MEMLPVPPKTDPAPTQDCVKELSPEEIQAYVRPKYDAKGERLPDPNASTFVGIIRGGNIVGALCLQLKLHAQPMMIEDGYSEVFEPLVHGAEEIILKKCGPQWVYLFAPAGRLSQLAQAMGMQLEPWNVLSKLVMPEAPSKSIPELMPLSDVMVEGAIQ